VIRLAQVATAALAAASLIAGIPDLAAAQVTVNPGVPQRAYMVGVGLRDAGDLGTMWTLTAGAQWATAHAVSAGLAVRHEWAGETECPTAGGVTCVGISSPTVTAADLHLEFRYGQGVIHPYGIVSLGAARFRARDEASRWSFAYSTGLGLRGRAGRGWWLFAEGRWRRERFGSLRADGIAGALGVNLAF
jgi:hypothetical protein